MGLYRGLKRRATEAGLVGVTEVCPGIDGVLAQLLLDTQQLVVLGETL